MAIQRTIKVTTTQHILKNEPKVDQFPMRKWSIQVSMVGPDGKDMPANVFDKVTYKLHPTFANPTRAFKAPPFKIEEKGWGEFYVYIVCHIAERGGEQTITHDLNFRETEYEVLHTMNFPSNKPGLLRLLAESGSVPEKRSSTPAGGSGSNVGGNAGSHSNASGPTGAASNHTDESAKNTTATTTTTTNATANNSSSSNTSGNAKRKQAAAASGHDDSGAKFKKKPKIEKGSVDLERLAEGLKQLSEEDLYNVVQMVTDNLTQEMYIKNDVKEGEFHMDLFTLPDSLLKSLWEYVKKRVSV